MSVANSIQEPFEGDDTGGIKLRPVRMGALSEEDAGRTVQLGYDDALGAVDNERAAGSHVGGSSRNRHPGLPCRNLRVQGLYSIISVWLFNGTLYVRPRSRHSSIE